MLLLEQATKTTDKGTILGSFFIIEISVRTHKPRIFLFMNSDHQDYGHANLFHVALDEVFQV